MAHGEATGVRRVRPLLGCLLAGLATGPAVSDIPTKLPSPPKPPAMSSSLRRLTAVPEGRRQAATWRRIADTPIPADLFRQAAVAGWDRINPRDILYQGAPLFDCLDDVRAAMVEAL